MPSKMNAETKLVTAYNLVFDVKDELRKEHGGINSYIAYEACERIESLLRALGFEAPERYDAEVSK